MVDASVHTDSSRQKLNVDKTALQPQGKIAPVEVGDWVKRVD